MNQRGTQLWEISIASLDDKKEKENEYVGVVILENVCESMGYYYCTAATTTTKDAEWRGREGT